MYIIGQNKIYFYQIEIPNKLNSLISKVKPSIVSGPEGKKSLGTFKKRCKDKSMEIKDPKGSICFDDD